MTIVDAGIDEKCCCSCTHNIRKQDEKMAGIYCECEIDKHYIDFVECFSCVCEEYKAESEEK